MSKAFDFVPHERLLLLKYGVGGGPSVCFTGSKYIDKIFVPPIFGLSCIYAIIGLQKHQA